MHSLIIRRCWRIGKLGISALMWYNVTRSCAHALLMLGRRQVVRHQVLVLAFGGSNPSGPAIYDIIIYDLIELTSVFLENIVQ